MPRLFLLLALLLLHAAALVAQGGPPFRADDPDTPGNRHWEINFGFISDRNPGNGGYQVPDFDINYGLGERIQLKYELPIALEETRPQPMTGDLPAVPASVIAGLGESLLGVKWRFFEHRPGDASLRGGFGTGLTDLFHHTAPVRPPGISGNAPGHAEEPAVTGRNEPDFELGTYPQLYLNNPTGAVARGLVASGPSLYLPLEISGRLGPLRWDADAGYNFGNRTLPQSWNRGFLVGREFSSSTEAYLELYDEQQANRLPLGRGVGNFATTSVKQRETTLDLGGRQALNHAKTLNLLLMGGRSFQVPSADTGQPGWIAYVGLQLLLGPSKP